MDQKKIGGFLRALRKEKSLTQEQLSETLGVSTRTISRWETGSNMPDLDILVQIADFYAVELRELFDGQRRDDKMNKEANETVIQAAEYGADTQKRLLKRMNILFIVGAVAMIVFCALHATGLAQSGAWEVVASFVLGVSCGVLVLGVLYTSRYMAKIRALKLRLVKRG